MNFVELMKKDSKELSELYSDYKAQYRTAKQEEAKLEQLANKDASMTNDYEEAIRKRASAYSTMKEIEKALKRAEEKEKINASKRPLPDVPSEFKSSHHYFNKKKELNNLEQSYKQDKQEKEKHVKDIEDKYRKAVVTGSKDVKNIFDELEEAESQLGLVTHNLKAIQVEKERILEDTVIEILLSRVHLDDMFKDKQQELAQKRIELLKEFQKLSEAVSQHNHKYALFVDDYKNIERDLGTHGISKVTNLYQRFSNDVGINRSVKMTGL